LEWRASGALSRFGTIGSIQVAETENLADAVRRAREVEAAHFDAIRGFVDSKSLRLQVLKLDIEGLIKQDPDAPKMFNLALLPGEPPRLWVDLVTSVVMEPDARTYRLQQDLEWGREILLETLKREEIIKFLRVYLAHRLVQRERQLAGMRVPQTAAVNGHSNAVIAYASLTGFLLGLIATLLAAISLGKLKF
jgi:hypothetical protein